MDTAQHCNISTLLSTMTTFKPEGATRAEILARLSQPDISEEKRERITSQLRPRGKPQADSGEPRPDPKYISWEDFLANTTEKQRLEWCRKKAAKANSEKLMSGKPNMRVSGEDVLAILAAARGRCMNCKSLALENRPSSPSGKPLPWASVGRRIGSLGHKVARIHGGGNEPENLSWTCLWCNTWPEERWANAVDHGAVQ